jgi:Lrp/AsnC family leucine-responsive transcriptional regulator
MTPHAGSGAESQRRTAYTPKLDATDLRIIAELQQSSNITNAALAQRIGISPPSTLDRVRKLERSGVITNYVALVDAGAIHKCIQAIVHESLSHHSSAALARAKECLGTFDEIQACWHTAGDEDFVLKVIVGDMDQYERFISERLSTVPSIAKIRTAFVLSTVKQSTQVPIALNGEAAALPRERRRGKKS